MPRTPEDTPTDADQLIRFGTVASVDLASAKCVVTLDDDAATPAVRWIEGRQGKTRTWSPPSVGEQVVVLCPAGEIGAAVALRGLVSDANPAAGDSLKEILGQYEDGAVLSYDPEAHVLDFTLPGGGTLTITAPGGTTLNGDLTVNGDAHVTGTVTGDTDVVAAGISGKGHTHGKVKTGTDETGSPE